ncbi:hypothetical protein B0T14DRAFT_416145 [Immersiella caudata]|uniref:MADS-box domain-containing protein n=1 Tax=Immersiella caudata TaxID=314043 RepID=A0AA40CBN6_9PEZI|nr:hypothetical protein B0T14DRAFT_416145 [Immersiella caudata]
MSAKRARRLREQSRNRRKTIFRKADELRKCNARVYLLVEMGKRCYIYNSERQSRWPPPHESILEERYPLPIEYGPGSSVGDDS